MPNWVKNVVTLKGDAETVKKVVEFVKGEKSVFDFDKIIPQPESIKKYDTANHPYGEKLTVGKPFDHFEKDSPIVTEELIEEYKKASEEQLRDYGCIGWYDWRRKYWGTKWNCCDAEFNGTDTFYFDTAWSTPYEVLVALSIQFPDITIELTYADEDAGYNVGEGTIENGVDSVYEPIGGSDSAMDIYFRVWGGEDEWQKNEDGEWEYIDC